MEKKNNKVIKILLSVIIFIVGAFCILLATDKISFNFKNDEDTKVENNQNNNEDKNEDSDIENNDEVEIDYSAYNGTWLDNENEISILATDEGIKFSWTLHRIATIDEVTIPFENGKGIFYLTDYNEFTRKATIELGDNGVNIIVEDVSAVDTNYIVLDEIPGVVYIEPGTYDYSLKADIDTNNLINSVEITKFTFEKPRPAALGGDSEFNALVIDTVTNLDCSNDNIQGIRLSGYCLDTKDNKYIMGGPVGVVAFYCDNISSHVDSGQMVVNKVFDANGNEFDTTNIKWEDIEIKYCKIDLAKFLSSDFEIIPNLSKELNYEKEF